MTDYRKPCLPWRRWWHGYLRQIDEASVVSGLKKYNVGAGRRRAFQTFTSQRGQEHWHCACSDADYVRVINELG